MNDKQFKIVNWKVIGWFALAVAGIIILAAAFGHGPTLLSYLPFLLILACPLMMIFMMGSMGSMGNRIGPSGPHDGAYGDTSELNGLTQDERVRALHSKFASMELRQDALRQDLKKLESEQMVDAERTTTTR